MAETNAQQSEEQPEKKREQPEVRVTKRGGDRGDLAARESGAALFDFDPFALDPFTLLQNVVGLLDLGRTRNVERTALAPLEVFERGDELVVRADLPGVKKDDVTIEISNGYLLIEGERIDERADDAAGFYRSERSYGSFRRAIALPDGVDADTAKAQFKDGVLEIAMKQRPAQSKRLHIEPG